MKGAWWLADMPGALPNRLVRSRLSSLLAPEVKDAYLAYLQDLELKVHFFNPQASGHAVSHEWCARAAASTLLGWTDQLCQSVTVTIGMPSHT